MKSGIFQGIAGNRFFSRYKSLILFLAIAALMPLITRTEYTIHTLCMMMLYAFLASSWNILGGFCGHFSLGNGVYMGLGAYITAAMFSYGGVTPWITIPIAALAAALISLVLSYPCFKLRGSYYCLCTIALLSLFRLVICNEQRIFGLDLGASVGLRISWRGGIGNMQFDSKVSYYYIIMVLLAAAVFISIYLQHSKTGYYFSAITTNQVAAEALGVNTTRYKLKAQFISAFLTALGGGFYLMLIMYIDPNRILGATFSIEIMLYAVIGGIGSVWGPVLGALALYPISEGLRGVLGTNASGLPTAIYGLVMMLVIYFMPSGIFPWIVEKVGTVYRKRTGGTSKSKEVG